MTIECGFLLHDKTGYQLHFPVSDLTSISKFRFFIGMFIFNLLVLSPLETVITANVGVIPHLKRLKLLQANHSSHKMLCCSEKLACYVCLVIFVKRAVFLSFQYFGQKCNFMIKTFYLTSR